jgi:hypothetical protein
MPGLQAFLDYNGYIYTVRQYYYTSGPVEIKDRPWKYNRTLIKYIKDPVDLLSYYAYSGFTNIDAWWLKIESFIPEDGPKWLYKIERS